MNSAQVNRWSTVALIGGGLFLALFTISHPATEAQPTPATQAQWIAAHTSHWVGAFLLLFGLMGVATRLVPLGGRLGLVAFLMAFSGTAIFFAGGVVAAYVDPIVPITALISSGSAPASLVGYIVLIAAGAIGLIFGWALMGVALERAGLVPIGPAVALAIGAVFFLIPPPQVGPAALHAVQGVVFGAALAWVGLALRRGPARVASSAPAAG